jgi:cytochrome c-type biogenesis protein
MSVTALSFAFGAGLLASVNPCGFVMLPALVSYYLGAEEATFAQLPLVARVGRAMGLALSVTLGFLLVFGGVGALVMSGGRAFLAVVPYAALLIGVGLVLLGCWLLAGRELHLVLPQRATRVTRDTPLALVGFGVSYAVASISCTLPIFLIAVGQSILAASWGAGLATFVAYGVGMGTVLLVVALATAFAQAWVHRSLRRFLPIVTRLSGVSIALAGAYIIVTQANLLRLQG